MLNGSDRRLPGWLIIESASALAIDRIDNAMSNALMSPVLSGPTPYPVSAAVPARNRIRWSGRIFIGCLLFLFFQDSLYRDVVPNIGLLRVLIPLMLLGVLFTHRIRVESQPLAFFLALFAGVGLMSGIAGVSPILAFIKLGLFACVIAPIALTYSLISQFYPDRRGFKLLFWSLTVLLTANLVHRLATGEWLFVNPNMVGMLTVCLLPLALYRAGFDTRRRSRQMSWLVILLCLGVAALSYSRASIVADFCILMTFSGFRRTRSINVVILQSGLIALIGITLVILIDPVTDHFYDLAYKGRDTLFDDVRMLKIRESFDAFVNSPLLGYGFGLSWLIRPEDVDFILETGRFSWIIGEFGNSTLALLIGGGILLALAYYAVIIRVLISGFRGMRLVRRGSPAYGFIICLIAAITGLTVHAQAEGWVLAPLNWVTLLFWLYCGLLVSFVAAVRRTRNQLERQQSGTGSSAV